LVAAPVFLPFLQLPLVQELISSLLRGKAFYFFLRRFWPLLFGLGSEQSAYLKLSPYKVGILGLISDGPPWPSFDDAFDEVRVVSSSDKYLDLSVVFFNTGNHKSIGVGHFPHKISVVVQLVRRLELPWSFQHDIPSLWLGTDATVLVDAFGVVGAELLPFLAGVELQQVAHSVLSRSAFVGQKGVLHLFD
jgi:hypothetical protein